MIGIAVEIVEVMVKVTAYAIMIAAWLIWALVALSIAGVAKLSHNDQLAAKMIGSLYWKKRKRTFHGTAELDDGSMVTCHHHHRTEGAALECAARISRRGGIV